MPNLQLMKNLFILRKTSGLTQEQISSKLNISRQAYSNYETGTRTPDLDTLLRISQLYNISLDTLIIHSVGDKFSDQSTQYTMAINVSNTDTLYLSETEVEFLLKFRDLDTQHKKIIEDILSCTPENKLISKIKDDTK